MGMKTRHTETNSFIHTVDSLFARVFSVVVSLQKGRCRVQRGYHMVDTGPIGGWIGQGSLLQRNDIERQT